jgi:hypothetical protein
VEHVLFPSPVRCWPRSFLRFLQSTANCSLGAEEMQLK